MSDNYMQIRIKADMKNESFIRSVVGAFCVGLNPTLEEINDIKTAVSEAVTNSIVHGYEGGEGDIWIDAEISGSTVRLFIADNGIGIEDIPAAMQPFYTTKADQDRSGMGFTVMQAFMDELTVTPNEPRGLKVEMKKTFRGA